MELETDLKLDLDLDLEMDLDLDLALDLDLDLGLDLDLDRHISRPSSKLHRGGEYDRDLNRLGSTPNSFSASDSSESEDSSSESPGFEKALDFCNNSIPLLISNQM